MPESSEFIYHRTTRVIIRMLHAYLVYLKIDHYRSRWSYTSHWLDLELIIVVLFGARFTYKDTRHATNRRYPKAVHSSHTRPQRLQLLVWSLFSFSIISHLHSPNDIRTEFYVNNLLNKRVGVKTKNPRLDKDVSLFAETLLDSSFSVPAAKLWNRLPKTTNPADNLDTFKILLGCSLHHFPDHHLVTSCTRQNRIIHWTIKKQSDDSQMDQRPW